MSDYKPSGYMTPIEMSELLDILAGWVAQIGASARPPQTKSDFPDALTYCRELFRHEEAHRVDTDEAARVFLDTGAYPADGSPWVRYFLSLRIQSAIGFIDECACENKKGHPLASLQKDFDYSCKMLLCTLWHGYRRDYWLKMTAFSVYHDLPLFGIEPAK